MNLLIFSLLFGCSAGKHKAKRGKNSSKSAKQTKPLVIQQPSQPVNCDKMIKAIVQSRSGGVQKCYTQRLVRRPRMRGRVGLSLHIDEGGWVKRSNVTTNTTRDRSLEKCVKSIGYQLSFPQGCSGTVTFYFALEPSKTARKIEQKPLQLKR